MQCSETASVPLCVGNLWDVRRHPSLAGAMSGKCASICRSHHWWYVVWEVCVKQLWLSVCVAAPSAVTEDARISDVKVDSFTAHWSLSVRVGTFVRYTARDVLKSTVKIEIR